MMEVITILAAGTDGSNPATARVVAKIANYLTINNGGAYAVILSKYKPGEFAEKDSQDSKSICQVRNEKK